MSSSRPGQFSKADVGQFSQAPKFLDVMWHNAINVGVYGSISHPNPQTLQERHKAFRDAYDVLQKEIPDARAKLEDEFRKLLGDDSQDGAIAPGSSDMARQQAAG